jgi:hypothetical protein
MKRTYDTGTDTNKIELAVNVGTVGTAYTSVYLSRSGGQNSKIAESNEDSGNIKNTIIGEAKQVKTAYLIIRTTVDFSNIDKEKWSSQAEKIVVRYHLDGGFSGNQIYNYDTDDVDIVLNGKVAVITKPIELT